MEFKKGDRVLHKKLQLKGTFIEYSWTGKDECYVDFDTKFGGRDRRRIDTNQLVMLDNE